LSLNASSAAGSCRFLSGCFAFGRLDFFVLILE
jgi:hypothetical protein